MSYLVIFLFLVLVVSGFSGNDKVHSRTACARVVARARVLRLFLGVALRRGHILCLYAPSAQRFFKGFFMCLFPITIKNLNYGALKTSPLNFMRERLLRCTNTQSSHIEVPCGHCVECASAKQNYFAQRSYLESLDCDVYMLTLTYRNDMLPHASYDLPDGTSLDVDFADSHDFHCFIQRVRKRGIFKMPFKYMCVNEFGSETHRPHFHVLFFVKKSDSDFVYEKSNPRGYAASKKYWSVSVARSIWFEWSRNVGTRKNPVYRSLSNFTARGFRKPFDFHFVDPYEYNGKTFVTKSLDVFFYTTKYLFEFDKWYYHEIEKKFKDCKRYLRALSYQSNSFDCPYDLSLSEYELQFSDGRDLSGGLSKVSGIVDRQAVYASLMSFRNLIRPRVRVSKFFGVSDASRSYVERVVSFNLSSRPREFFVFVKEDGSTCPLSPYLRDKFVSVEDYLSFYLPLVGDKLDSSDAYSEYSQKRSDMHLKNRDYYCNRSKRLLRCINSKNGD